MMRARRLALQTINQWERVYELLDDGAHVFESPEEMMKDLGLFDLTQQRCG